MTYLILVFIKISKSDRVGDFNYRNLTYEYKYEYKIATIKKDK